jgi:hypothetical protein
MPDDETSNSIFVKALEQWEQPHAVSERSDLAAERARETSPGRFLQELESWEWPAQPEETHQIVLAPEQRPDPVLRKLLLRVKGSIEVIAGRALDVWAGKPVLLERAGRGLVRARRLDSTGRVRFGELVPGEYIVHTSGVSGLLERYSFALVGAPVSSDAAAAALDQEHEFLESGLRVSVKLKPQSEISITFSTKDEKFADSVVRFAFSAPSTGKVQLSGKVVLSEPPWQTGSWVGKWQYAAADVGNCELLFVVESK